MALRDIALAELTGGVVHIAHMSARQTLDAVRYGKSRGARVTCEVTPHHFVLTDEMLARAGGLRHQRQDEPAAARGGRPRRDARRASPTAASTSSPPITRRITTTRSTSSSTARRSASPASRRRCRCASIAWCTPASISLRAAGRAAVGQPGADPARARRFARAKARRPTSRSSRRTCAVTVSAARMRSKSKNTPFDGWHAARRRRRDHRRRPDGLRQRGRRHSSVARAAGLSA